MSSYIKLYRTRLIHLPEMRYATPMKQMRTENLTDEQIAAYRRRLAHDPEAEVTGTEVRAILGISWNVLSNWLDEKKRDESPVRWRKNPFDTRSKLVKLADVLALLDQQEHISHDMP